MRHRHDDDDRWFGPSAISSTNVIAEWTMLAWLIIAPLGRPVVPEV